MREVIVSNRDADYFTKNGLMTLSGLYEHQWPDAVIKELLDNSLDVIYTSKLQDRWIRVNHSQGFFSIHDSFDGIPEAILDKVLNFSKYVSTKSHYVAIDRGCLGNALKTIIGICHILDYRLYFVTEGKKIHYEINESLLDADIVEVKKTEEPAEGKPGIYIDGISLRSLRLRRYIELYYILNPDVTFFFNDERYAAVAGNIDRSNSVTPVQWYSLENFKRLLQVIATTVDAQKTVKEFCRNTFSGIQRQISKLDFRFKKLGEFYQDEYEIESLYYKLRELTIYKAPARSKKPKPSPLLKKHLIKDTFLKVIRKEDLIAKRIFFSNLDNNEGSTPFIIEGYLLKASDNLGFSRITGNVLVAINNSIPYDDCPFVFSEKKKILFCKKEIEADSLSGLLKERGFKNAKHLVLFLHFVAPYNALKITTKAKDEIISDEFLHWLIPFVESLLKKTIKQIDKAAKKGSPIAIETGKTRNIPKSQLLRKHFMESFEIAAGSQKIAAVRQVFYQERNIINIKYQIDITDYNYFTQIICTEFIEEYPELEDRLLFERRGYFYNPFDGSELPLGTGDVISYITAKPKNKIYERRRLVFSFPVELQIPHVLFIEKAGFNVILKQSGLLNKLNLGVISTQGFGTRACKRLMDWFISRGIKVYILHDCDIQGYLIDSKFKTGSATFKKKLDVECIGLKLNQVHELNKMGYVEEFQSKKKYKECLKIMTEDEKKFFIANAGDKKYRRVELNTLTSDELVKFIEDRIPAVEVKPSIEQLESFIEIDSAEIIKKALYEVYGSKVSGLLDIDIKDIARKVHEMPQYGLRWTDNLINYLQKHKEKKIEELVKIIQNL
ncbi:MAG: hypothetical protein C4538_03050 [Nitrospiraceae bacterium]|nr:MAG: hypothetical protein C4538_03050 [Nitrospiraceae bacterium]